MDTIDVVFKNYLGIKYSYSLKSTNSLYRCDVFDKANPSKILLHTEDRLKTVCFAKAIGGLLLIGITRLNTQTEFSKDFNSNEFPTK